MSDVVATIKLTAEELRLLMDGFGSSFIHDGVDPDTAELERISHKLSKEFLRIKSRGAT